jgi:hypothetical protein
MLNPLHHAKTIFRLLRGRIYKGSSLSPETEIPIILRQLDGKESVLNVIETPIAISQDNRVYLLQKPEIVAAWSWPRLYRELALVNIDSIDVDNIRGRIENPDNRTDNR